VSGTIAGGQVRCDYCGATMQVGARPRESAREHVATEIDESARLAGLRAQVESFDSDRALLRGPDGLDAFERMLSDAATRAAGLEGFRQEWEKTRRVAAAGRATPETELQLLRLAFAIAEQYAQLDRADRARAVLETALDLIADADLRDLIRARLARQALLLNDVEAGAAWLADVNPRPLKLEVDSESRIATALLAYRRGDHAGVLAALGETVDGAPMLEMRAGLLPHLLRAHALAGTGRVVEAKRLMRWVGTRTYGVPAETARLVEQLPGPAAPFAVAAVRRGDRTSTVTLILLCIFVPLAFGTAVGTPACVAPACPMMWGGAYDALIGALNRCAPVRELLGDDITWAVGCIGEGEGGCDNVSFDNIAVKGSKARGRVDFHYWNDGGVYGVTGSVRSQGQRVSICR
jgi:hypothetical protein